MWLDAPSHYPRQLIRSCMYVSSGPQASRLTLSMRVMKTTETVRMDMEVMNQESRRTPSPRPIIFMYSLSLNCDQWVHTKWHSRRCNISESECLCDLYIYIHMPGWSPDDVGYMLLSWISEHVSENTYSVATFTCSLTSESIQINPYTPYRKQLKEAETMYWSITSPI